jgi:FkbM family methyltransferase
MFGETVYPPEKILDFLGSGDVKVIIMSAGLAEISAQLDSLGVKEYYSAMLMRADDGEDVSRACRHAGELIDANKDSIDRTRSLLADSKSMEVLDGRTRLMRINDNWRRFEITSGLYTPDRYFPDDIPSFTLGRGESFVDAGAYTGDTVAKFLAKTVGEFSRVSAFEPDAKNFSALRANYGGRPNISLYQAGLFSCGGTLKFQANDFYREASRIADGAKTSAVADNSYDIEVVALDEMPEITPTLIKMDIEGSELEALKGAAQTIKAHTPKLAICLYHKLCDLWEIPLYVHELVPGYKLYVRHHIIGPYLADTVLYAVM